MEVDGDIQYSRDFEEVALHTPFSDEVEDNEVTARFGSQLIMTLVSAISEKREELNLTGLG